MCLFTMEVCKCTHYILCLRGTHTGLLITYHYFWYSNWTHLYSTSLAVSLSGAFRNHSSGKQSEVSSFYSCESCVLGCSLGKTLQLVMIKFQFIYMFEKKGACLHNNAILQLNWKYTELIMKKIWIGCFIKSSSISDKQQAVENENHSRYWLTLVRK